MKIVFLQTENKIDEEDEESEKTDTNSHKLKRFVIVEGKMLLAPEQAQKIYLTIVKRILPQLHKSLTHKVDILK